VPAGDRYEALLREAAHRLADTVAPYRVLTRERLAALSEEDHWRSISFEQALRWAVDHDVLRQLDPGLYEITSQSSTSSSSDPGAVRDAGASIDRR
jgi:hypothetical protein